MKTIIIIGLCSFVLQTAILSQVIQQHSNEDSLSKKSIDFNNLSKNFSYHQMQNSDVQINEINFQIFQIDSVKYIYELLMVHNLIQRDFGEFSHSSKMLEYQKQVDLILLPGQVYYKNQPNYDLGEVGKYLGVSKTIFALMLGIISL